MNILNGKTPLVIGLVNILRFGTMVTVLSFIV